MLKPATLLLTLLVGSPLILHAGDEPPREVQTYLDALERQRAAQVALLKKENDNRLNRLARAIQLGADYVPDLFLDMKAGSIGVLVDPNRHFVVSAQVERVIDAKSVILRLGYIGSDRLVSLETDTSGLIDDQNFETEGKLFEMVGTKTYKTAEGKSKTVPVLRPFDKTSFDKWRKTNPVRRKSQSNPTGNPRPIPGMKVPLPPTFRERADQWANTKELGLPAYRLIAVEDPQTQTTWPLAGAVIVAPQALLTMADVGIELAKLQARGMKVKILRDSQDVGVPADRVRIHAAFQKASPEHQLYFDLAIVSTSERLAGAASQASAAELATIERGQPLACVAINHSGEAIDRFQQLQPEWQMGKVFAVTALSSEGGAPRLLHLRGAFGDKSSGSPIFDNQGRLVAVYCDAAADAAAPPDRAIHYAKLIEPKLIELGLSQTESPVWVAPVVPAAETPKEPAK